MEKDLILTCDAGTTGCKVSVFNTKGEALFNVRRDYPTLYPRPNWAEQDPDRILDAIYETANEDAGGDLRISGLNRLLQYPEFSDSERFGRLLTAIEGKEDILNLVSADADDVNVIIGSESSVKVMDNSSVIYKPIKKNLHTIGAIGVIGPLRMDYAKDCLW